MIKKIFRFTSALFERCFRRSDRLRFGYFTFLTSHATNIPRFAVVVGKKTAKSAVVRNRLRRQLYAVIRKKFVPQIKSKNIICLYNGPEILENTADFERVCDKVVLALRSPAPLRPKK